MFPFSLLSLSESCNRPGKGIDVGCFVVDGQRVQLRDDPCYGGLDALGLKVLRLRVKGNVLRVKGLGFRV